MPAFRGKDAHIIVDAVTLARVQAVTVDIDTGLETLYEMGSPMPKELVQGNVEITGTIEGILLTEPAWQIHSKAFEVDPATGVLKLKEFDLKVDILGAKNLRLTLYGCKAETGTLDLPQDGWLGDAIDIRALRHEFTTF